MKENGKFSLSNFLEILSNTVFLNLFFIVFSLPIVTMGASLTAMYAGLRAAIKHEPCYRAFFRTLKKSFLRSTLAWLILLPVNAYFIYSTTNSYILFRETGSFGPLIISALIAMMLLGFSTVVFLFYSRFEVTLLQLFQYSSKIFFDYPLRSIIIALLTWIPFILPLFYNVLSLYLLFGMVWLFYFATIATMCIWLMNQPFALFAVNILNMDDPRKKEEA